MPEKSLRERYDNLWPTTRTEEEFQLGLRGIIHEARRVLREAQGIRVEGHRLADTIPSSGYDLWGERRTEMHAVVSFITDMTARDAKEVRGSAYRTLLIRQVNRHFTPHRWQRFERLGILPVI